MSTASSDDTHEATASLHKSNPWPCPHCRYDLRSNIDSWKEESVTCPECGESSTAIEITNTLYFAAPYGWIWNVLSWLPVCWYCLFVFMVPSISSASDSSKTAIITFVFLAPCVWLFGLSMYRYRYAWSLGTRVGNSFLLMIGLQFANVIVAFIIGLCAAVVFELLAYIL